MTKFKLRKELKESRKVWEAFKSEPNNTYESNSNTRNLTIESYIIGNNYYSDKWCSNKESVRDYNDWMEPSEDDLDRLVGWIENEDEIRINDRDRRADKAITLDEVYHIAENYWLKRNKDFHIFFSTHNNGMISYCVAAHKVCMDDCFIGIRIKYFKAIE